MRSLAVIIGVVMAAVLYGQIIPGQYIVQTAKPWNGALKASDKIEFIKTLDEDQYVYLVKAPDKEALYQLPYVLIVEEDAYLENRNTPNDPLYADQWGLDNINIKPVWDNLTDAVDFGGREVIVAVLDDGFQINHEDLQSQWLVNEGEVPFNSLDDDGNGIVDDYIGWNVDTGDSDHVAETHGTAVAGILGARGDNAKGISGVSWNIKMLPISGINMKNEIIMALAEIRELRRLYNVTGGQKGAYIVANNYSGGIPNAFAEDNMLWCNQYEELGRVGVISVGATVNRDSDVEVVGDMPSLCTSNHLIVTTNTDRQNQKVQSAGYGAQSIDLGAPGKDIISTNVVDRYTIFNGTSAAAPHVAGAIGLLYATPCESFYKLTLEDPESAATQIRESILSTVSFSSSLGSRSTSEGVLNVWEALKVLQENCGGSTGDLAIISIVPEFGIVSNLIEQGSTARLKYETPDNTPYNAYIFNATGKLVYEEQFNPPLFAAKTLSIPTIGFVPGVYYVTLIGSGGQVSSSFVVY